MITCRNFQGHRSNNMKAKTNVYRHGTVWCHATWIDGEFDCSGPLDIADSESTSDAIAAAKMMFSLVDCEEHIVAKVDDIPDSAGRE